MSFLLRLERHSTGSSMRRIVMSSSSLGFVRSWAMERFPGWDISARIIRDEEPEELFDDCFKTYLA